MTSITKSNTFHLIHLKYSKIATQFSPVGFMQDHTLAYFDLEGDSNQP